MTCDAKLYNPTPCKRPPLDGRRVCAVCAARIKATAERYGINFHRKDNDND